MSFRRAVLIGVMAVSIGMAGAWLGHDAWAGQVRTFTFGHDQPADTAYGVAAELMDQKLSEFSNGAMRVKQFASGALGQEPEMVQKVRTGDIDFAINSTANTSTVVPQAGVFSLHYIFRDEAHLEKVVNDPAINELWRKMTAELVPGARTLGLMTLGMRNMYAKFTISGLADVTGKKVHMPFGQVFTSLQTGLVQIAENGNDNYFKAKHYEAAPVLNKTEHEANNFHLWISQKTWDSLNDQEKKWVTDAAAYVRPLATKKAIEFGASAVKSLQALGVKWNENVDKKSLETVAIPLQDAQAKELGSYSVQFLNLFRNVK